MQALEFLALVLVNLAVMVYLVEKGTKFWNLRNAKGPSLLNDREVNPSMS